jgi:Holliday junction resolvase RusA-like endonuclease
MIDLVRSILQAECMDFEPALVVLIPLPVKDCSPNGSRGHWAKKQRAFNQYRDVVTALCQQAMEQQEYHGSARIRLHYIWFMAKNQLERQSKTSFFYRPTDIDNAIASLKHAQDGLGVAGLFNVDNSRNVKLGEVILLRKEKDNKGHCTIAVIVEDIDGKRATPVPG